MKPKRTKLGAAIWIGVVFVVSGVFAVGVFFLVLAQLSRGIEPEVIWHAADGTPAPEDFVVLMYPADGDVAVHEDADDASERIGTLDRAMGNRVWELEDEWIGLTLEDGRGYVLQDRLVYDADPSGRGRMIAAMRALHEAKAFDPALGEVVQHESVGTTEYTARADWSGGSWQKSRWRVVDGRFEPVELTGWHEQNVAMQGIGFMIVSAMAACVAFVGSLLVGVCAAVAMRHWPRAEAA
ncbi:MAG: hypothetical protein DHS20C14_19220 [Phycisphaeraceae bacterium]|nr:MAG: hypothetical protein DHS20C14_19220 [Phycisphaeraceae bacterium]